MPRRVAVVLGSAALLAAVPAPARAGAWEPAGRLATGRAGHTATTLGDGALVAGGRVSPLRATRSAERYDASFRPEGARVRDLVARPRGATEVRLSFSVPGPWRTVPGMRRARVEHTAIRLDDGRVLVAGGDRGDGAVTGAVELYDPERGRWSRTGALRAARASHTATLLPDGRVLVAGGRGRDGDALAAAELFDPRAGTWTSIASMAVPRLHHTASLLADGSVLVAGGESERDPNRVPELLPTRSAERFDPATGRWRPAGLLAIPRTGHTATRLGDGRVLLVGGVDESDAPRRSAELFEPGADLWSVAPSMTVERARHVAVLLPDGRMLAAAGRSSAPASAELFDPGPTRWERTAPLRTPRREAAAVVLAGPGCAARCGQVLVTGGFAREPGPGERRRPLRLAETFDPRGRRTGTRLRYVLKQSGRPIRGTADFRRARSLCGGTCAFTAAPGERLTVTVTGLRPGRTYYYALRSRSGRRLGPLSNLGRVRTGSRRARAGGTVAAAATSARRGWDG